MKMKHTKKKIKFFWLVFAVKKMKEIFFLKNEKSNDGPSPTLKVCTQSMSRQCTQRELSTTHHKGGESYEKSCFQRWASTSPFVSHPKKFSGGQPGAGVGMLSNGCLDRPGGCKCVIDFIAHFANTDPQLVILGDGPVRIRVRLQMKMGHHFFYNEYYTQFQGPLSSIRQSTPWTRPRKVDTDHTDATQGQLWRFRPRLHRAKKKKCKPPFAKNCKQNPFEKAPPKPPLAFSHRISPLYSSTVNSPTGVCGQGLDRVIHHTTKSQTVCKKFAKRKSRIKKIIAKRLQNHCCSGRPKECHTTISI
jgi:hypothetical protein